MVGGMGVDILAAGKGDVVDGVGGRVDATLVVETRWIAGGGDAWGMGLRAHGASGREAMGDIGAGLRHGISTAVAERFSGRKAALLVITATDSAGTVVWMRGAVVATAGRGPLDGLAPGENAIGGGMAQGVALRRFARAGGDRGAAVQYLLVRRGVPVLGPGPFLISAILPKDFDPAGGISRHDDLAISVLGPSYIGRGRFGFRRFVG